VRAGTRCSSKTIVKLPSIADLGPYFGCSWLRGNLCGIFMCVRCFPLGLPSLLAQARVPGHCGSAHSWSHVVAMTTRSGKRGSPKLIIQQVRWHQRLSPSRMKAGIPAEAAQPCCSRFFCIQSMKYTQQISKLESAPSGKHRRGGCTMHLFRCMGHRDLSEDSALSHGIGVDCRSETYRYPSTWTYFSIFCTATALESWRRC